MQTMFEFEVSWQMANGRQKAVKYSRLREVREKGAEALERWHRFFSPLSVSWNGGVR